MTEPSLRGAKGDEAIQRPHMRPLDCFASLAMTAYIEPQGDKP